MIIFEITVAEGHDPDTLLSEEVLQETHAQVMTLEQASLLGFSGIQPNSKGLEVRLIAVDKRDALFVQRRLEANEAVQSFRPTEVGG